MHENLESRDTGVTGSTLSSATCELPKVAQACDGSLSLCFGILVQSELHKWQWLLLSLIVSLEVDSKTVNRIDSNSSHRALETERQRLAPPRVGSGSFGISRYPYSHFPTVFQTTHPLFSP